MTSKAKSKQEEALKFLDDLDSFTPPPDVDISKSKPVKSTGASSVNNEGEAEVLAFLDEITQKSTEPTRPSTSTPQLDLPGSRSGTPTLRKSTERVKIGGGGSTSSPSPSRSTGSPAESHETTAAAGAGSWKWGSVWSTASAAIQQAKTAVDEQVKSLPNNEQARKWGEGVMGYAKAAHLDKLGQDFKRVGLSTLTDILNVVAPPISEHEVLQVWLSHEMQGYDGVESLVYRALTRVMEQVEGGDLVVNRGDESKPKESTEERRNLNCVEGYEAAIKLAQADIDGLIKGNAQRTAKEPSSVQSPTTYSHIYLRIQAFFTTYAHPASSSTTESSTRQLHFLIYLTDPGHQLMHTTITQAVPQKWLAAWDEHDWVEDLVAEALRVGIEVVGQEYLAARMGWDGKDKEKKAEAEEIKAPAGGEQRATREKEEES